MTILSIFYSVYDKLSNNFGPLQEFTNEETALRAMKKSFNSKDFEKSWACDFVLYCLGHRCVSDDCKQFFEFYDPVKVCDCSDLLKDDEEKGE